MSILRGSLVVFLMAVLCCLTGSAAGVGFPPPESTHNTALAIVGAKIYPAPDAKPIANGVVIVVNGKIASVGDRATVKIPSGAMVLDCSGMVLTAVSYTHLTLPTIYSV